MRIGVLGTTVATGSAGPVNLGGPKQRALLAALALHRGRAVAADTLADLVWDGAPPPGVSGTLQGYVAGLRRALEPDRTTRGSATLLVTEQPGYALRLPDDGLDAVAFEAVVASAHTGVAPLADALCRGRPLPPGSPDAGGLITLHDGLEEALGMWRGVPFAELGDVPAAVAERARLEELRVLASEDRAALGILLGLHATAAAELDALTRAHPLRERAWALRALALAGSGRQADALAVLREVRDVLDEELGLEPGPELRAVQGAVLRQEQIATAEPAAAVGPAPPAEASGGVETHAPLPFPSLWPWSLAGRDEELAALSDLVDRVVTGAGASPAFVALTGEPGIGKSRLAIELATYAAEQGVTIAWGRCSQDDGAPALWPWATVLERLGAELPSAADGDDQAAAFRAWETVVQTVLDAAGRGPLLLVLDDLHWADTSSLRVLRLLTEAVAQESPARLLVVSTWREHPVPTGPLAEVTEALARKHALRLQLRGISAEAAAHVFSQVAETDPTDADADTLRRRTEGNPFFVVEYARLAKDGDLAALVAEGRPPAAVHEVLSRRLAHLEETTQDLLQTASVLGRIFDLRTLAQVAGLDDDDALDRLDPAIEAGLVAEDGVDRFRFSHALIRDTVLSGLPQSRRARVHARAAEAVGGRTGRETEVARHWLAAGPRHLSKAWPAAQVAARSATTVFAYVEALEMLEYALSAQDEDPASTPADRFEVLTDLADVLRRAGRWMELREVAHEAIEVADEAGDLDLLIRAAAMTSTGALWTPGGGEVDEVVVRSLRHALDRLPEGDDPRRCRVMLSLAGEIYYGTTPQEREALAEEAVAMARRLDDPVLVLNALVKSTIGIWRGANAALRLDMTTEAVRLARELGDTVGLVSALALRAEAAGELGDVAALDECLMEGRPEADRIRHVYAQLFLDSLEVSWSAMRGQFDQVAKRIGEMADIGQVVTIPGTAESIAGALMMQALWQGGEADVLAVLETMPVDGFVPTAPPMLTMLCRTGRLDDARAYLTTQREYVDRAIDADTWYSPMAWSMAAESACYLDDRELAATAYALLAPLAGQTASAGSGSTIGPVDIFLAMAAHTTGQDDLAARHAERAVELCEAWQIPLARDWCVRERERLGI
ncbi:BTAD domain-containing putative transcriptional regulator [Nocardioides sp. YIM 152315]|uniref:BTAD domain-containing putative transcriptional regulator n=1 Tax=Nocardioides sp. YIM 152315 TaxID=3031760 RepID=UPI0023DA72DF|nr:BTAD domain-containing putative transcriptional regulator [Nocardioides sp. YIM 152315]MDF1606304.1 BTAD domain-containing putative transcriptional regulator [Nocardioides sp. YIM 152315]